MDIRNEIVEALKREIVGPSSNVNYLDKETGEEILLARVHGAPKSRYGAGMLYPQQSINHEIDDTNNEGLNTLDDLVSEEMDGLSSMPEGNRSKEMNENGQIDEEPVGLANQYLPSAMGFTVRFYSGYENDQIKLNVKSAYYQKGSGEYSKKKVNSDNQIIIEESKGKPVQSDYWIRRPITPKTIFLNINSLFKNGNKSFNMDIIKTENGSCWLKLRVFNRTTNQDVNNGFITYTFVIINNIVSTTDEKFHSNSILFQNELILNTDNPKLIAPYQEKISLPDTDEENELNLLYRKKRIYAIGHGASVLWKTSLENGSEIVKVIKTSVIPVYDISQIAPTSHVELSMLKFSDFGNWNESKEGLIKLVSEYSKWIQEVKVQAQTSDELHNYRDSALLNVKKCQNTLHRIQRGVNYLLKAEESSDVVKCFRWMNRAMLWQQQRSKIKQRKWVRTGTFKSSQLLLEGIDGSNEQILSSIKEFHDSSLMNGRWRPFQLAFVLLNIDSIINPTSTEREIIDLIWFPTGGGKTEAYLGVTAFNIFYRRLKGKKDWNWDFYGGTTVLMRYTLRLLTTQQYERAASLICACDLIRKENEEDIGSETITIGLWVGGSSTPNKNSQAIIQLNILEKNVNAEYNFVVMKCPCCGAQIGKIDGANKKDREKIKGIKRRDGKNGEVYFQCDNPNCEYMNESLPLQVVDDLIYKNPPTLLLGTVDKFAMIPWKKETGNLFGFREGDTDWTRISPPELIIQDELHLIAGPLGTMVGLYETMIQTLCNDYNKTKPPFISAVESNIFSPKIIASSATISRSYEQAKGLYGIENKNQLNIFPAQGLEFGDTWFSIEKSLDIVDIKGKSKFPGRKYIGILASGYPSAQTSIVRAYSSVLQKVKELDNHEEIDYYWSLLGYFNSIRELGGASSLVYGDIRERLGQIQNRELIGKNDRRYINRIQGLTSRVSSSKIPETLKKLEVQFNKNKNKALDICLATNMVATGVDISRLGLMFIHGQPKTTAEYIQASSRVGRELPDGPGLIFTIYSPAKPRDKSQYEQFQGYHSRIYSNVEPTSVTPFSINARERGLHAVQIGLIRHYSQNKLRVSPRIDNTDFESIVKIVNEIIINRCKIIDSEEVENTRKLLDKKIRFWRKGFQEYGDAGNIKILKNEGYVPLMYAISAEVRNEIVKDDRSLGTSTSMRGVDTESVVSIYSNKDVNDE